MTIQELLTNYIQQDLLSNRSTTPLGPDDNLLLSGLLDSISVMTLITFIETKLGIEIPLEDMTIENFDSIRAIEAYLARSQVG